MRITLTVITIAGITGGHAVEPQLEWDGYVDAIGGYQAGEDLVGDDDFDIRTAAQVELGYRVDDRIHGRIELYWTEDGAVALEQALVTWAINERTDLIAGRFESWIGWEGADAPELYRVNPSFFVDGPSLLGNGDPIGFMGVSPDGLGVVGRPTQALEFGFAVVDHVFADPAGRDADAISAIAAATWALDGIVTVDLDLSYGRDEWPDGDVLGIDLNLEIDALRRDHGWLLAADLNYTDYDVDALAALQLMASYELPARAMRVSVMVSAVDPALDDEADQDDAGIEFAAAWLANPIRQTGFVLGAELRYIAREAEEADEWGAFVQFLAVVP